MSNDQKFLKMAMAESQKAEVPHLYGAVVVQDGKVIARGYNRVRAINDPSAHAEMTAIVAACKQQGSHNLENCTLYSSHEPCLMCFCEALWAEIDRIVYANPASEADDSTYGFTGVSLKSLAAKFERPVQVELIRLTQLH